MLGNWWPKLKPLPSFSAFGGGAAGMAWKSAAGGFDATGGTTTEPGNGYKYHAFTAAGPSPFVVNTGGECEVFMMAGGGAGGGDIGGGGGCTLYYHNAYPLDAGNYLIAVGGGGSPTTPGPGHGGSTSVSSPTALVIETGAGDRGEPQGGQTPTGGYGGAGKKIINGTTTNYSGGNGTAASGGSRRGGGGGGIGGAGENYDTDGPNHGGDGGVSGDYPAFAGPLIGVPALNPLGGKYGGGGGGGTENPLWTSGLGGGDPNIGGGSPANSGTGGAGTSPANGIAASPDNTGSGGGGGGGIAGVASGPGGDGSPGICIIRYAV